MRVIGLDGRQYPWKLTGRVPLGGDSIKRSGGHLRARKALQTLFPHERLLEEVPLPGSGGLRLDFFLASLRLAVEVQGSQHRQRSSLFHPFPADFFAGLTRDAAKRLWCEKNKITLVELPDDESDELWRTRLVG